MAIRTRDRVYHALGYGHGIVVQVDDRYIKIKFDNGQVKDFQACALGNFIFPVDLQGNPIMSKTAAAQLEQEQKRLSLVREEQGYVEDYVGSAREELRNLDEQLWNARRRAYEDGVDPCPYRPSDHHIQLRSIIDEPFRVHLYLNEQGMEKDIHVGKHDVYKNGQKVIFSWNSVYGQVEVLSRLKTTEITANGLKFTVKKRRDILFRDNAVVDDVRELDFSDRFARAIQEKLSGMVNQGLENKPGKELRSKTRSHQEIDEQLIRELHIDDLRASRLRQSSRNLNHIFWTISYTQSEIVRSGLEKAIVIQGGAGSGKSSVGMHRLAFLIYNGLVHTAEALGPSEAFARYAEGLLKDIGMAGEGRIKCRSKNEFLSEMCGIARKLCEKAIADLLSSIEATVSQEGGSGAMARRDEQAGAIYRPKSARDAAGTGTEEVETEESCDKAAEALRNDINRLRLMSLLCLRVLFPVSESRIVKGIGGISASISDILAALDQLERRALSLVRVREDVINDLERLQRWRVRFPLGATLLHRRVARLTDELSGIDKELEALNKKPLAIVGTLAGLSRPTVTDYKVGLDKDPGAALRVVRGAIHDQVSRLAQRLRHVLRRLDSGTLDSAAFLRVYTSIDPGFRENSEVRKALSDYYFVDEGQDWTIDEYRFLRYLVGNRVTIAGDINQKIWTDGGIDDWDEVNTLFDAYFYELKYNWRSTVPIVDAAQPYKVNSRYDNIGIVDGELPQYVKPDPKAANSENTMDELLRDVLTRVHLYLSAGKTAALILGNTEELEEYVTRLRRLDRRKEVQQRSGDNQPTEKIEIIIADKGKKGKPDYMDVYVYKGADRIPEGVIVTSIDYVKGFEFNTVVAVRSKGPGDMTEVEKYRMYTTITRATDRLYVLDVAARGADHRANPHADSSSSTRRSATRILHFEQAKM